jgi:hypothetical protein
MVFFVSFGVAQEKSAWSLSMAKNRPGRRDGIDVKMLVGSEATPSNQDWPHGIHQIHGVIESML